MDSVTERFLAARKRREIHDRHTETRVEMPSEIMDAIATLTATVLQLKADLAALQTDHGRIKSLLVRVGEEAERKAGAA